MAEEKPTIPQELQDEIDRIETDAELFLRLCPEGEEALQGVRVPPEKLKIFLLVYARTFSKIKAAKVAGIGHCTIKQLCARSEAFRNKLQEVEDIIIQSLVDGLIEVGKTSPSNAKWILSRMRPKEFGDRQYLEANINTRLDNMTDEDLRTMITRGTDAASNT